MSSTVSLSDQSAINAAIADVRSDSTDTNYVICGHTNGNHQILELRTTGTDTSEIASQMAEDEALYALARYECEFDMSKTIKFVYIRWIGEKVKFVKRGRLGVVSGSIMDIFGQHHLFVETSSLEDLDKDKVVELLKDSAGTKNKILENSELSNRQMRGFTQTQLPQKDNRPQFGVSAVASKGSTLEILPDVNDAVNKVKSDTDPETWMVAGYKDGNVKGPLETVGTGTGDLNELKSCLQPDGAMYGMYRVHIVNSDDISTVKFVYIKWVGNAVKPMAKAKLSTHKGALEEIFFPVHTSIYATESADVNEQQLMGKLKEKTS